MRRFILWGTRWHYAVRKVSRGDKGKVFGVYFTAACGSRGYSYTGPCVKEFEGIPPSGLICQRCAHLRSVPKDEEVFAA